MAAIERFEDLRVWQKARDFANEIFMLTQKEKFSRDFSLIDQIRKSSGSVIDNIAEGFERGGKKELIHFLYISKSSAGETCSQLYRAFDRIYIQESILNDMKNKLLNYLVC